MRRAWHNMCRVCGYVPRMFNHFGSTTPIWDLRFRELVCWRCGHWADRQGVDS